MKSSQLLEMLQKKPSNLNCDYFVIGIDPSLTSSSCSCFIEVSRKLKLTLRQRMFSSSFPAVFQQQNIRSAQRHEADADCFSPFLTSISYLNICATYINLNHVFPVLSQLNPSPVRPQFEGLVGSQHGHLFICSST